MQTGQSEPSRGGASRGAADAAEPEASAVLAPEAAKLESFRAVRRESQEGHSIGASASLEERSSSNVRPQASHRYS